MTTYLQPEPCPCFCPAALAPRNEGISSCRILSYLIFNTPPLGLLTLHCVSHLTLHCVSHLLTSAVPPCPGHWLLWADYFLVHFPFSRPLILPHSHPLCLPFPSFFLFFSTFFSSREKGEFIKETETNEFGNMPEVRQARPGSSF